MTRYQTSSGRDRHRQVAADAEQFRRGADTQELGDDDAAVGDQHHRHREERPADAEALAHQVEQAAAGRRAQSGAHLLDERQSDRVMITSTHSRS